MLRTIFYFSALLLWISDTQAQTALIPMPSQAVLTDGTFLLSGETPVLLSSPELDKVAYYLRTEVLKHSGITLHTAGQTNKPAIHLNLKYKKSDLEESYQLDIKPDEIVIQASHPKGLFYGVISLMQILRTTKVKSGSAEIAGCKVVDAPAYTWRGFMLDESRHFFGKEKIKDILDCFLHL